MNKILVVDDEPTFTRLLKINLEVSTRYIVAVENDPNLALAAAIDFHGFNTAVPVSRRAAATQELGFRIPVSDQLAPAAVAVGKTVLRQQ